MNRAEKHIRHYNLLNGNSITRDQLQRFHDQVAKDIDSKRIDAHMPFGVECIDLKTRLASGLKKMQAAGIYKINKLEVKLIDINKILAAYKASKAPQPKPIVKKTIAAPAANKNKLDGLHTSNSSPSGSSARPAGPAATKPDSKLAKLNGFERVKQMHFKKIQLDGEWAQELNPFIYSDTQIMFWGMPGSGKTVKLLKFAQYLAQKGLNVLYLANEEMNRSTLTEKANEFNIGHPNLKAYRSLKALEKDGGSVADFDAVFFDSINSMGMDLKTYRQFVEDHPGKIYIPIVQCTKDGGFRGGQDWEHEVDIAGAVVNRKVILRKNRLDPNFRQKAEALELEELINEKKKKHQINQSVKNQLKGPAPAKTPPLIFTA
jgi:hypothetical protein